MKITSYDLAKYPEKGGCGPGCVPMLCAKYTPEGMAVVCRKGRPPEERAEQRRIYSRSVELGIRIDPPWER